MNIFKNFIKETLKRINRTMLKDEKQATKDML